MRSPRLRVSHASFPLLLAIAACGPVGSGPGAQAPTTTTAVSNVEETSHDRKGPPFVARLAITQSEVQRDADLEVVVMIENRSKDPLIFSEEEFTSPNVMFEVRDKMGEKIRPAPPPVPSGRKRTVDPGKQVEIKMKLAGMFSPPLPPGDYTVRLKRMETTPHSFKIAPVR